MCSQLARFPKWEAASAGCEGGGLSTATILVTGYLLYNYIVAYGSREECPSSPIFATFVDGAVPRHSIELALDISVAPHAYKGPCLLGRPTRRRSHMRVQLMASAGHATRVQSHDLEFNPL